jgi:hypothetical protein
MLVRWIIRISKDSYNPASRSASVMASRVDGGTEKPSASFSGCVYVSLRSFTVVSSRTSSFICSTGVNSIGSTSSGIESCIVPLTPVGALDSMGVSSAVPFGVSTLGSRE